MNLNCPGPNITSFEVSEVCKSPLELDADILLLLKNIGIYSTDF